MSNPQGPGKQGRKDAKAKAPQPHQTGAPGRSEHQQQQGHTQHRSHPSSSHPSQSIRERENIEEDE